MARLSVQGFDFIDNQLTKLSGRDCARRIVQAGADACSAELEDRTNQYHHVVTGNMVQSIRPGRYHEDIDVCWQDVYPQGDDSRGVSNAKKAFVINYGYGSHRTAKTGDKFITGKKKTLEQIVGKAMKAEADRILNETR